MIGHFDATLKLHISYITLVLHKSNTRILLLSAAENSAGVTRSACTMYAGSPSYIVSPSIFQDLHWGH